MHITLCTPQNTLYSGTAHKMSLRTTGGDIAILPGHTAYMAEIGKGHMEIHADEAMLRCETTTGIIYNRKNEVSILRLAECNITVDQL